MAQTQWNGVEYQYDFNGNRVRREYKLVYMKRGIADSTEVEAAISVDNKITVALPLSPGSAAERKDRRGALFYRHANPSDSLRAGAIPPIPRL